MLEHGNPDFNSKKTSQNIASIGANKLSNKVKMRCPSCEDNPVKYNKKQVEAHAEEYDKELERDFSEKKELKKDEELKEEFPEDIEDLNSEKIIIKDHFQGPHKDECGYCGKSLASETCINKNINGIDYEFCSEECYDNFMDALHFKDEEI